MLYRLLRTKALPKKYADRLTNQSGRNKSYVCLLLFIFCELKYYFDVENLWFSGWVYCSNTLLELLKN